MRCAPGIAIVLAPKSPASIGCNSCYFLEKNGRSGLSAAGCECARHHWAEIAFQARMEEVVAVVVLVCMMGGVGLVG